MFAVGTVASSERMNWPVGSELVALAEEARAVLPSPSTAEVKCQHCGQEIRWMEGQWRDRETHKNCEGSKKLHSPSTPEPQTVTLDQNRCAICGWTLAEKIEDGCVRGNCSMRPFPRPFYDPERAKAEYAPLQLSTEFPNEGAK